MKNDARLFSQRPAEPGKDILILLAAHTTARLHGNSRTDFLRRGKMKKARSNCAIAAACVDFQTMQKSAKKTRRRWLTLLACAFAMLAGSAFPCGTHAAICEVGDGSKGYWRMVGAPYQGACIIPGPPHPDSAFLNSRTNEAFRIEGRYKIVTILTGKGFYVGCPECLPGCITGFAEWGCTGVYGNGFTYEPDGQLCIMPGGGGCACFTDGNAVTLYEWVWTDKECDKEDPPSAPANTPNPDPGDPKCSKIPLN